MPRFRSSSRLAAVLVALVLAGAAPNGAAAERPHSLRAGFEPAWWTGIGEWLTDAWAKVGCSIDPNGQCKQDSKLPPEGGGAIRSPAAPFRADVGCSIDPDGCKGRSVSPPQPAP
jgi:hypothetical protein